MSRLFLIIDNLFVAFVHNLKNFEGNCQLKNLILGLFILIREEYYCVCARFYLIMS